MMKRILGVGALLLALPVVSMADQSGPGCGAGAIIWKGQSGMAANVLAATTNGMFGNQTLGMTFGTLGCNGEQTVSNEYEKKIFVASNMDNLAEDAAKGSGDHLASLAELVGVASADKSAFFAMAKANYSSVFTQSNQDSLLVSLNQAMSTDPVLVKYTN